MYLRCNYNYVAETRGNCVAFFKQLRNAPSVLWASAVSRVRGVSTLKRLLVPLALDPFKGCYLTWSGRASADVIWRCPWKAVEMFIFPSRNFRVFVRARGSPRVYSPMLSKLWLTSFVLFRNVKSFFFIFFLFAGCCNRALFLLRHKPLNTFFFFLICICVFTLNMVK